jgi:hypothetical protein
MTLLIVTLWKQPRSIWWAYVMFIQSWVCHEYWLCWNLSTPPWNLYMPTMFSCVITLQLFKSTKLICTKFAMIHISHFNLKTFLNSCMLLQTHLVELPKIGWLTQMIALSMWLFTSLDNPLGRSLPFITNGMWKNIGCNLLKKNLYNLLKCK